MSHVNVPTLYLGRVTVSDSEFHFHDYHVNFSEASLTFKDDIAQKTYIDAQVKTLSDRIEDMQNKIDKLDWLYRYFFRRHSTDASSFDETSNQILFTDDTTNPTPAPT
jgi:hypothetical protein